MRFSLLALLLTATIAGCGNKNEANYARVAAAPEQAMLQQDKRAEPGSTAKRYLAYEHSVEFHTAFDKVEELYNTALKACNDAAAEQCTVLDIQLSTYYNYNAQLKFRAKPEGIQKILKALGDKGTIVRQSTSAEDLSGPISDSQKRLEILRDYRSKLEALRSKASSDIESLIKVNEQLAQTQGEIESLTGQNAYLMQRVDTEILNIQIGAENKNSFWHPISRAMSDFGSNLSSGISGGITAIAYLIPWGLLLFAVFLVLRLLWRRLRKARQ